MCQRRTIITVPQRPGDANHNIINDVDYSMRNPQPPTAHAGVGNRESAVGNARYSLLPTPCSLLPLPTAHWPLPSACCVLLLLSAVSPAWSQQSEPPALNPFGAGAERVDQHRDDTVPGFLETSDGKVHPGQITLTRDARLKIYDEQQKKHREIPLKAIKRIDCTVLKEWMEDEWRFKENASDEKYFTGRSYPSREYTHKITLQNGRKIEGALSAIVYVRAEKAQEATRFLLHKRDKGDVGTTLKSLVYVRSIQFGPKALEEGKRKAAGTKEKTESKRPTPATRKARPRT